jgi:hypothetical protein
MASRSMAENQDVVEEARNSWCRFQFLHTPATVPVASSSARTRWLCRAGRSRGCAARRGRGRHRQGSSG